MTILSSLIHKPIVKKRTSGGYIALAQMSLSGTHSGWRFKVHFVEAFVFAGILFKKNILNKMIYSFRINDINENPFSNH
jgi:hypothetical protein